MQREVAEALQLFRAGLFSFTGLMFNPAKSPTSATAVLIQPNLDVGGDNEWAGPGRVGRPHRAV